MATLGNPKEWAGLLDTMTPKLLSVTVAACETLVGVKPDTIEDSITRDLCGALRRHPQIRSLPFQVHTQQVELKPEEEQAGFGVLDIVFNLLVPDEEIYFCLEAKRLNVNTRSKYRSYASEYVRYGMMRFVEGKYSRKVRQGGMIGYVLDGAVHRAKANVDRNVARRKRELRLLPPHSLSPSASLPDDSRVWQTRHRRVHQEGIFHIHHLFVALN